ncbi:MAG: glycosyltransferase involved in cell wall biosynthesis, partial [Halieaceae bacterium]
LKQQEAQAITVAWRSILSSFKPQIVITFGTSVVAQKMQDDARQAGAQIVFFLANAEIDAAEVVKPGDRVVTPSHFLAERYSPFADRPGQVLRSIVDSSRYLSPEQRLLTNTRGMQRAGLVTFMNPIPQKGLTLLTRLAQRALAERSDMTFAVLEGRMTPALLRKLGVDLASFQNVWWLPAQRNMRAVYARTSILLAPSFCQEGLARCVLEAHLSGIPALASERGGLPETFPEAGKTLPIPKHCIENMNAFPDDNTVDIWWRELSKLWNDDEAYMKAVQDADANAIAFAPETTRAAVRDAFEQIASTLDTGQDAKKLTV